MGPLIKGTVSLSPIWKAPYRFPSCKKDGDIGWRLLHLCLSSPHLINKMNAQSPPTCPFCLERGTLPYMFLLCVSLTSLKRYLQKILHRISTSVRLDDVLFLFHLEGLFQTLTTPWLILSSHSANQRYTKRIWSTQNEIIMFPYSLTLQIICIFSERDFIQE